jgi:hypothetical protein
MSETEKMPSRKLILGSKGDELVRFSYLNVHAPKINKESGKLQRGVVAMIDKRNTHDVSAIQRAIEELSEEVWPKGKKRKPPLWMNPLRDGDTAVKKNGDPVDELYRGHYIINCTTDAEKPLGIVGTIRDENGKFKRLGKDEIKSGDFGRLGVVLRPYTKGNSGVSCYLSNVQMVREGPALAGGASAEEDFGAFDDPDAGAFD